MKNLFTKSGYRILSLIVAAAILFSGIPISAAAEGDFAPDGCVHEHDEACGYIEAVDCTHECGEDCAESCAHQHDEDCGYTEAAPCTHEHDEDCGNSGLVLGESGDTTDGESNETDTGDANVATSGVTSDETCVCTAFCDDPDCPVCKEDYTQCFFYYCVCEVLCGEGDINEACPICAEDYTSCVLAVEPPAIQPFADVNTYGALQSAMSAAGTDTITLTGNITDGNSQLTVNGDKTLNLNNKNLTITVTSDNGIKIASGAKLTIQGTGTLTVNNAATYIEVDSGDGAGINTTDGTLIVMGGTIKSYGGGDSFGGGAGIGGGDGGTYGTIEISGGSVEAIGNDWSAGIGSGPYANNVSSSIKICGNAEVTATGGWKGAGIGGGGASSGGNITIEGSAVIVASGGESAAGIGGGGINDGVSGDSGNITISGGTVEATSGDSAGTQMAIGKGDGSSNNTITITGNYNYWSNTTNGASGATQGSGTFTNNDSYKYVKLVEITGVAVSGVSLNKSSTALAVGGSETLTATVAPADATDKSVTWSSNNESVATVNQSGVVTAVAGGTAMITVTTTDGGKTATCEVTVNRITPTVTTWPTASAIIYGQTLNSSTLSSGSSSVAGSFAWTTSTTAPGAGTASHSVTFSPSEPNKYNTVTGTVNVTVNKALLTITGFSISKVYDGNNTVTGGFGTLSFSGLQNSETATVDTSSVTATYNNATVGAGKSITFSGSFGMTGGNANASNYTITQPTGVTGAITAANQSALSITGLSGPYTYGDAAITLGTTGGSGTGSVSYVSNNTSVATVIGNTVTIVKAGNFTITATKAGDSNYNPTSVTSGSIAVNPRNISNVSIAAISNQTYTGSQITPAPSVSDSGATITASDYDVSYGSNINTGTGAGSITITGKGNYTGTNTVSFNIVAAALTGKPAVSGTVRIGDTLTVGNGTLNSATGLTYQWNANGTPVNSATNATYIVQGSDVGKTITVTVTASGNYTGAATSDATAVVPYTIIVNANSGGGDSVAAQTFYKNAGESVNIAYTLANTHIENKLTLSVGGNTVATTTNTGTSTVEYAVNAAHATGGVITMSAAFSHTSVLTTVDVSITEPMTGAAPQTSLAGLSSYYGSHNVTWTPTISGGKFLGSTVYTVTVTLNVGAGTTTFDNSFAPKVNGEAATLGDIVQPTGSSSGYVSFSYTFDTTATRQVDSIAVTTDPQITYYSGDTLNMAGLVVMATYNDGTTGVVTPDSYAINGTPFTPGSTVLKSAQDGKPITVIFDGKQATTSNLTVNKLAVQLGSISGNESSDDVAVSGSYDVGDIVTINYTLANTGLVNTLTFNNGINPITTPATGASTTYTVNKAHANASGVITITASFSHTSILTTANVGVTAPVKGETPNNIVTPDSSYYSGTVTNWNGSLTPGGKFAGGGIYSVTVTLSALGNATFSSSFTVTVSGGTVSNVNVASDGKSVTFAVSYDALTAKEVVDIAVTNDPQTTYYSGDTLNMAGLVVTATYDDGTTGTVTTSDYKIYGTPVTSGTTVLTNAAHGGKPVTVTYSGKTADTTALTVNKLTVQLGTMTGNTGADAVTLAAVQKDINENVTIGYTLDSPAIINRLTLGNGLAVITTPATSSVQYTVNVAHAVGGTITFNPVFSHVSTLTSANISVTAPVKAATPQSTIASDTYYTGTISWNDSPTVFYGDTIYSAAITLTAQNGATFGGGFTPTVSGGAVSNVVVASGGGSVRFTVTFPKTTAKAVDSISVMTQPKLIYVAGDKLDLSALIIKVDYDDTTTEDIAYNKSGVTYEINSKPVTSGSTIMAYSAHGGKTVKITYGGVSNDTSALTVYTTPTLQISVSEITVTSAKITYSVTQGSNAITSKLQVRNGSAWTDVVADASSPSYYDPADTLTPNTGYEYRLWAKDNVTNREYTSSVTFKTTASVPGGVKVEGTVTDNGPPPPASITVTIEHGNTVIASDTILGSGTYNFSFSDIPNGIYNLVSDNGSYKVTQAVEVKGANISGINIIMTGGNTQSIVDIVTPDTPPTAVGGLPELFAVPAIYTSDDKDLVDNNGGTVEIKLTVEKQTAPPDAGLITNAASGQTIGLYLDLSVIKSQFDSTGALLDEQPLKNLGTSNLLTITFELPSTMSGETVAAIYRAHDGGSGVVVETLTKTSSPEYFEQNGDIITLYVYKFSTYAIAYTPSNPPINPPNPPSSGGGSSSSGGGGSSGSGTASTIVSTYWIEVLEAKTMAKAAKEQGAVLARSRRATITGIRKASLAVLADADLRYHHDTVEGNAVQVRIYVDDPAKATKDILVSGYVKGDAVDKIKAKFEKWFRNKVAVVNFDQQGDFGMVVQIAAKADLTGMDTSNLYFYGYDRQTNKYSRINTEYRIDANGYLHFATWLAGDIIVSSGPLSKEVAATPVKTTATQDPQNPETGGDGVTSPPTQVDTQNPDTGGDSLFSTYTGGILKLENLDTQSAGRVLVIDLDGSVMQDALSDSLERDKVSVYVVMGITSALLLAAMMLWAVIPRKNDPLVSVEEYRKMH